MARLALLLYGTAVTHATHTVGVVGPNTLCFEDCYAKSDGDCDDGGDGSQYSICSYGNDCVDCGPRFATVPNPTPAPPFISLTPLRAGRYSLFGYGECGGTNASSVATYSVSQTSLSMCALEAQNNDNANGFECRGGLPMGCNCYIYFAAEITSTTMNPRSVCYKCVCAEIERPTVSSSRLPTACV